MNSNTQQLPMTYQEKAEGDRHHLIDVAALAQRLGVTQRFIRRLTAEDRVPFLKIGKFVRFDPQEIDRWIDEARCPAVASNNNMKSRLPSS